MHTLFSFSTLFLPLHHPPYGAPSCSVSRCVFRDLLEAKPMLFFALGPPSFYSLGRCPRVFVLDRRSNFARPTPKYAIGTHGYICQSGMLLAYWLFSEGFVIGEFFFVDIELWKVASGCIFFFFLFWKGKLTSFLIYMVCRKSS